MPVHATPPVPSADQRDSRTPADAEQSSRAHHPAGSRLRAADPAEPQASSRQTVNVSPVPARQATALEPDWDDPELGATTAEYAVLTLAAVAFAGILAVVVRSGPVQALLQGILERALTP